MTPRPDDVLECGALKDLPSPLYRDYLAEEARVAAFYGRAGWRLDSLEGAVEAVGALPRRRDLLSQALTRQQQARGAVRAAANALRLADEDAVAVVTGQQAGLFGGPLYVLYKALAATKLAAALEVRRGKPVVPVFWVVSDDHDFAEVRSVSVIDQAGEVRTLRYNPEREPIGLPAGKIVLDKTISDLVDESSRVLPATPGRDALLERIAACYRPGVTLAEAFMQLLSGLLPELVVLDPSDPDLRRLMAPVLAREVMEESPTSRLAEEVGSRLLAAGYHQQVPLRTGFLNLFVMRDGQRRALAVQDGLLEVRGLGLRMTVAEATAEVNGSPEDWSPGVLLRPLAQDTVLPTVAYIGGPAEIAYHAQVGPSYAHFGIPRPVLVPRPSLTLVEPAQARTLESERLTLPDLLAGPETILARWAHETYPEVEEAFQRTREALEREMGVVERTLGALDPTLPGAVDAARGRALHQVDTLHEKATRALKKRDQARADRLRRTRDALLPGGSLQERGLGFVGLLARHGLAIVDAIHERMDPWAKGHQVIRL